MPSRTFHNLINRAFLGFSGNDIHQYMDRASKSLRHRHREVGHDTQALMEMLIMFKHKYTSKQIILTFILHRRIDELYSGIQEGVKMKTKGNDSVQATLAGIKKYIKELTRI